MIHSAGPSDPNELDIARIRNGAGFADLRASLLSGDLWPQCRTCHIRERVPASRFRARSRLDSLLAGRVAPAHALPLRELRIEITMRCNLHCVYCGVSQPHYAPTEMSGERLDAIAEAARALPRSVRIMLNGHGETTYHPGWLPFCEKIVALGFRVRLTTNLARALKPEEAACLARLEQIEVSVDTADAALLRQLRRQVSIATIVANIERIRAEAARQGVRGPAFAVSCGVFDANYSGLGELAAFCVAQEIRKVTFWPLVKHADVPDARNVYPVPSLSPAEIRSAIDHVEQALAILRRARIKTVLAGGFLDDWRRTLGLRPSAATRLLQQALHYVR